MLLLLLACTAPTSRTAPPGDSPADPGGGDSAGQDSGGQDSGGQDSGGQDSGQPPDTCTVPTGVATTLHFAGLDRGVTVPMGAWASASALPVLPMVAVDGGAPLLFSDSPEYVDRAGILYADTVTDAARVYVYHATQGEDRRYGVVLSGTGTAATVQVTAEGSAGPWYDYLYTGRMAALRYETARAEPPAPRTVAVPANGDVLLDDASAAEAVPDQWLTHGIYDLTTTAPIHVSVVAADADPLAAFPSLTALPRDEHDRGTFAPSERRLSPAGGCYDTAAGALRLRVAGGEAPDTWAVGTDVLTGAAEELLGNYGVQYEVDIPLRSTDGRTVTVLLAARGGDVVGAAWGSVGITDAGVFDFPSDADALAADGSAVVLGRWNPAKTASLTLRFTPAGSTSLPMDLILVPE